jgi:hypothetical protein
MMDTIIPKILTFSLESSCISVPSYICALSPLSTLSAVPERCVFVTYKLSTISLHYSCYSCCSQGARSLGIQMGPGCWGGAEGQRQWAIFGKKAQHLSRREHCSLSGWDSICYLGLCLWNSNEQWTRDSLIVRQLWKLFRLPRRRPYLCNSAKRHWTTFQPTILWDSCWYPDILGYVEMKLPIGSLFTSLLDQNLPSGSLGRSQEER